MNDILKNKKKIVIILLVLILVLVGFFLIKNKIDQVYQEKVDLGLSYYERIHNLYYYGGDIEYRLNENGERNYIQIDNKKYYELSNYNEVFKTMFTSSMLKHTNEFLNIKLVEDKAYMKDFGRGLSGYYGTKLRVKKIRKNKIEYIAYSKFCERDYIVSYGDGCRENHYIEIEKPFTLVKENGMWKVNEYTSVFEFKDEEIK